MAFNRWIVVTAILLASPYLVIARGSPACNFVPGAPVKTTSGTVHGHRAHNATQVSEYLGIPYAQPPINNLRFAPPVRYHGDGDINATSFGHDCPIVKNNVPKFLPQNVYSILSQLAQVDDNPAEDCLYINVWSKPQVGTVKKPVLVWIYGGGFNLGGTNTSAYSGQFWADTEDVVFVNFNYRLNIFGFPGAPGETQNVGLLDQRMAIEWVRDNIEAFGGDVDRITIFGQSAGGASADFYNYAYVDDPIIAGSILMSGTATLGNTLPETAAEAWFNATRKLGCGDNSTSSDSAVLECMRSSNVTTDAILKAIKPANALAGITGSFGPTIDEMTVFRNYTERGLAGNFIKKPTLIGSNDYEAGLFILIALGSGISLPSGAWSLFTYAGFTCPAGTAAQFRVLQGVPVWRYRYFGMFPNLQLPTSIGRAWHGSELLPMFGSSEEITTEESTWQERSIGTYMRGAWAQFARCPESGLKGYGWPLYSNTTDTLVEIGKENSTTPIIGDPQEFDVGCGFPFAGTANS